jgi:hypothetical protein
MEGSSWDPVVRLKGFIARAREKSSDSDRWRVGHKDARGISRERQANENEALPGRREPPVAPVLRGRCGRVGVSDPGALSLDDSGSRAHRHLRFQQSELLRLVPGDKAASAGQTPPLNLLAGPGVFERRALHPDLLHGHDDPRWMEAREGRNGAQGERASPEALSFSRWASLVADSSSRRPRLQRLQRPKVGPRPTLDATDQ